MSHRIICPSCGDAMSETVTIKQTAALIHRSERTVRRWIRRRLLHTSKVEGSRLVLFADLVRLLDLNRER